MSLFVQYLLTCESQQKALREHAT